MRHALLTVVTTEDIEDVIRVMLNSAKAGDVAAAKLLLDRTRGKVTEPICLTGDSGPSGMLPIQEIVIGNRTELVEFRELKRRLGGESKNREALDGFRGVGRKSALSVCKI